MRGFLLSLLMLGGCAEATAADCERVEFEGVPISVCRVAHDADIRIHRARDDGRPFARPEQAKSRLGEGERLVMAMNAGMYHADLRPVGLYVEGGVEAAPLVTRAGPGNFGLVPNGVFWVDADGAHVTETRAYDALNASPEFATQSGPMLVVNGKLHPKFIATSTSLKIRNGVGVGPGGVIFAKTEAPVNFHTFARFFQGEGTDNALYLDGTVSRMWSAQLGRSGGRFPIGPLIAVVEGVGVGVEGETDR